MDSHPRGKNGRVVYDLEGDFGLDADELRRRFAFYTDEFGIRPESQEGRRPVKQPLNALIVKEGEGTQDAVAARRRHLHVEGHLQQLPRHHRRRRRADQHRHALRGAGDQAPLRGGEQQPAAGDRVHAGPRRPRRWMVAASTDPASRPSRRRTTPTSASTGGSLQPFYSRRTEKLWRGDLAQHRSLVPAARAGGHHDLPRHATRSRSAAVASSCYATPGGETTDSLVVWLPEERTVFTGNLMGPLFGHMPEPLHRPRRQDPQRDRVHPRRSTACSALEPEVLVTGHGEPIRGADEIQRRRCSRSATPREYLRDRTIDGMNAGVDLFTLMGQITLPPELDIPQGHGKVPWIVRAVWEEHVGLVPLRVDDRALRRPAVGDLGRAHRARGRHRRC